MRARDFRARASGAPVECAQRGCWYDQIPTTETHARYGTHEIPSLAGIFHNIVAAIFRDNVR